MSTESVLLRPWTGPYGGVPPWDAINPDEFLPAFETAIEQSLRDVAAIADNPQPPTFANTLVALEQAGEALTRLNSLFGVYCSSLNLGKIPEIELAVAPLLSQHADAIVQNERLFARIAALYAQRDQLELSEAQHRLLEDRYKNFVRQGAQLSPDDKQRLSQINAELAELFTRFSQNVLADEASTIEVTDRRELAGLPESFIAALAAAAGAENNRDAPPRWVIHNTRSSMEPVLTYAAHRPLREKVWRSYYRRGDNGGAHDNNQIITRILQLRAARAKLLGYPTHAHWRLEPQMAKTPENAMELLLAVWQHAIGRVREEVADMQQLAAAEGTDVVIEPWDYRYYAEKVRQARYDLDFHQITPYLQLEKLREGMMWAATTLYGFEFHPIDDVPVYHPDVRVWEVRRQGEHAGLFYFDPYARPGKQSGAWMNAYRDQQNIERPVSPIVSNNSNFIPGKPGEPVLISWDDAVTMFHEFGHALHGLASNCQYPSQSGTAVPRDYVEFPSQLNEHWLLTPEVLQRFAVHYQTGEPIPAELVAKIKRAARFNQGFATTEYLASALMDMKLHLAGDVTIEPAHFERETLIALGLPREIVMRHRTPHFNHVFSSDGYSAAYYSYLWSDALTADAAEMFEAAGSYYDRQLAERYFNHVLSVGDTIDPAEGFRRFRGRDVDTQALLKKRGFLAKGNQ